MDQSKEEAEEHAIILRDSNSPLSGTANSLMIIQNLSKGIDDLNNTINQLVTIAINRMPNYRTCIFLRQSLTMNPRLACDSQLSCLSHHTCPEEYAFPSSTPSPRTLGS
jgi:hypothetical protein